MISSCNKDKQLTPETQTEFGNKKNLSSDIPWANLTWASFHKAGREGNYPVGDNPWLGLDITDYIKEKLHNDPEVVPQYGQFKEIKYYKLDFADAYTLVTTHNYWHQDDQPGYQAEFNNTWHPISTWNTSVLDTKTYILTKLAELQQQNPGLELKIKYINFEQGHYSVAGQFPWLDWAGEVLGLTGFYYGHWQEATIDPNLQLQSDIPWDQNMIAALHKVGFMPNSPSEDPQQNPGVLLDASDYIEELCMLDPKLIPQHGSFNSLQYFVLDNDDWKDFVIGELWFNPSGFPSDEYYNEYQPADKWALYHPKVRDFVLLKLKELQEETGNSKLRVKAINFDQGHFYFPFANQGNPFVTNVKGHFHSLYGFYFGEWVDQ